MKRWLVMILLLCLALFAAPPALAQGPDRNGDHLCMGGSTTVGAEETPDSVVLFGCGARIKSGAHIRKDVVSFGGSVVLEEGTQVDGDVVVFGGNADIGGRIGHRVTVFGGRVTLESGSVVENDVQTFGGFVDKKEGAVVRGRFLGSNSPIVGTFPYTNPVFYGWNAWGDFFGHTIQGLITALALAALAAILLVFLPNQLGQVRETAEHFAMPSLGVGCLTWLLVPPLMILFAVTCIGIPLTVILGVVAIGAGVFGWIAISQLLGERLLAALKGTNIVPLISIIVGLFVLWLVTLVPVLGGVIWFFIASLALGAVVLTRFGTRKYPYTGPGGSTALVPAVPPVPPTALAPTAEPQPPVPPMPPAPPAPDVSSS